MTNVKMPDPVVWRSKYKSEPGMIGNYPWSYVEYSLRQPALNNYDIEGLITTTQAQAYADERVREALEKALDALNQARDSIGAGSFAEDRQHERGIVGPYLDGLDDEIRTLFPKQSTPA
ncbi:MAG: hypothetical protein CML16_03180 [Pusillimonas sp.]|nr:hypothetical protein [Pusillimonas sp.]MBC43590.1 hypothetical protein [Pusillimonas sp.]HCP78972.1 hypothetical protein [Pusillimonas sp.]|tara:strand:+ start:411 stop:767 length:357 start_codon:yes stop_codon:yes gene_type:complete